MPILGNHLLGDGSVVIYKFGLYEGDMLYSNNGGTTWQWQVALTHLRFPRSDFHLPGVSEVLTMKLR